MAECHAMLAAGLAGWLAGWLREAKVQYCTGTSYMYMG